MSSRKTLILLFISVMLLLPVSIAQAHVKWFADFSFEDAPVSLSDAITPTFIALTLLTIIALGAAVLIDSRLKDEPTYQNIVRYFETRRHLALLALRIGMGITLLLAWQGDLLLSPDLPLPAAWMGWFEFVLVLLILPQTVPLAGIGTLILYVIGMGQFGAFYMLDYFIFVGVGVYLVVAQNANPSVRGLRIPALFFSVGFSLMWVALEKIIYPQWGLEILRDNPVLTLGLDPKFFLLAAAFVELALGYLFIIGLLERPIALVVTLVFFGTTLVFGKTEVIGHTIIHAALIAFLLEGTARTYPAPINLHQKLSWRIAFAAVNFALVLAIFIIPYAAIAQWQYDEAVVSLMQALVLR